MTANKRFLKILVYVLAFSLALCFALTATAQTEDDGDITVSISQADTVVAIQANIRAAILGAAAGDTVTVTGSKTGVDDTLKLDIPEDITVVWKAEYTGTVASGENLIGLAGAGTFEVTTGGTVEVSGDGSCAIYANSNIITSVSGDAKILSKGINSVAIDARNVSVSSGTVEATGDFGVAIEANSCVSISGGTVKASFEGSAIIINNGVVYVSGASNIIADYSAIWSYGNGDVYVSGEANIAANYTAICATNVYVSDEAMVVVKGDYGYAIDSSKSVSISGGTVRATTGNAIRITGESPNVTISGGNISVTTGTAIAAIGDDPTINISGGVVEATD
ncbi:MAG: hypothetical protein FWG06_02665, partial [Clostridiales bacterium]|nr:hypothetical protein [Clostridiales bacterium]